MTSIFGRRVGKVLIGAAWTMVLVTVGAEAGVAVRRYQSRKPARPSTPIGHHVPSVALSGPDGAPETIDRALGGHPGVIFVVSVADCATCSNLPLEFRIIKSAAPRLRILLVGTGAPRSAFAPYFDQLHVASTALIDPKGVLLKALGVAAAPVTLIADAKGRVLLVDTRTASAAAQYPVGSILTSFDDILADSAR